MDLKLNEHGWELINLTIDTKKYNRLYKTAQYKEKIENSISVKYHLSLWILENSSSTYFICENSSFNYGIYKSSTLKYDWVLDSDEMTILKSDIDINELIDYINSEFLFGKQKLRNLIINDLELLDEPLFVKSKS